MKKYLVTFMATFGLLFASHAASIVYEPYDSSPAIRVYCGSYSTTISIYGSGAHATNSVSIAGTSTIINGSGDIDTVAEFAAAIAAATNSAGTAVLVVDTDCSLGTDSTDGELLTGSYTSDATGWLEIPWDTSACKFYSVYVPDVNAGGIRSSQLKVGSVYGNPAGTGNVTLDVYLDGTLAWQKLLPEVYAYTNNTKSVDLPVMVDIPVGNKAVMIRATRASTATTGILGATLE